MQIVSNFLQHKFTLYLIALLAGLLLPFAFAPAGYYWLAVLSPALLLYSWLSSSPKQAFWLGFIFGLGFFGVGISWVYISIHEFGNTPVLLAGFLTILFIVTLALFPAVQGYLLTRFFPQNKLSKFYLAFPSSWALLEWLRSWIGTGFPWLLLGASQTNSVLKGFIPIIGEFGESFLLALCSALLITSIIYGKRYCYKNAFTFILIILMGSILTQIHWTRPKGVVFTTALIQGNIPQQLKWSPDFLNPTLDHYKDLSSPYWNITLIVWPEAAIPALLQDVAGFITSLKIQAAEHYTTFIIGVPVLDNLHYYNSMLLLHNNQQQMYYKRHLVPFGEYLPFAQWLRGLIGFFNIPMSDFTAGSWQQPLLQFNNIYIASFICYEIAYQAEVLAELPAANILVTITNDAWFGHSFAAAQHLQIGQLRALETGRYHLFTANSGLTAIIDAQGNIQASLPPYQVAVLAGAAQPMVGRTPLVWMGAKLIIITLGLLLLIAYGLQRQIKLCLTN